jgi:hypothetical protein
MRGMIQSSKLYHRLFIPNGSGNRGGEGRIWIGGEPSGVEAVAEPVGVLDETTHIDEVLTAKPGWRPLL